MCVPWRRRYFMCLSPPSPGRVKTIVPVRFPCTLYDDISNNIFFRFIESCYGIVVGSGPCVWSCSYDIIVVGGENSYISFLSFSLATIVRGQWTTVSFFFIYICIIFNEILPYYTFTKILYRYERISFIRKKKKIALFVASFRLCMYTVSRVLLMNETKRICIPVV